MTPPGMARYGWGSGAYWPDAVCDLGDLSPDACPVRRNALLFPLPLRCSAMA
jgi:hypothetical protein